MCEKESHDTYILCCVGYAVDPSADTGVITNRLD